jgi:hypothetical protein
MTNLRATVLSAALLLPLLAACAGTTETTAPAPGTAPPAPKPAAAQSDEGWKVFGHALTLTQILMRTVQSDDAEKAFDDVLAGRSTEANRAIAGLLDEATSDMPVEYRSRVASIGQDAVSMARKQIGKPVTASPERALQARKDLTAMGLKYHDPNEFLAAVERDDALAVELFVEGRGVNLGAKDANGRTALEIARAKGNQPMTQLLARSLPAAR